MIDMAHVHGWLFEHNPLPVVVRHDTRGTRHAHRFDDPFVERTGSVDIFVACECVTSSGWWRR